MATESDHRGVIGYNVQAAVDTKHHIVVANEVTNPGHDRSHLLHMAKATQAEMDGSGIIALADRGYDDGEQSSHTALDRQQMDCFRMRVTEWSHEVRC